ncbi:Slipper [Strongyloides ratti]|uniref:Slipper n=1 Tax=Strongyloides ratti TaxID=34506 RepID=A0A090LGE4_STRRB|nr:Slipper [Strongyloides ratti]CEF68842.1 Slipper [Strongyloides ratti]
MVKQTKTINSLESETSSISSCELLDDDISTTAFQQSVNNKIIDRKFSSFIKPKVCSLVKKIIKPKRVTQCITSYQPSLINNLSIISDFEGFEYIDYNEKDFYEDDLEINHIPHIEENNLKISSTIFGSGAFCKVHKAYLYIPNKNETKTVAFKEVINRLRNPIEIMNELRNEGEILYQMNHRNIIKLYGIYGSVEDIRIQKKLGLVLECCRGGSLANLVHNIKFKDIFILLGFVKQIANGVNYLHQNYKNREVYDKSIKKVFDNVSLLSSNIPIINGNSNDEENGVFLHGDLKCDNILIKEKICLHSIEKYNNIKYDKINSNINNDVDIQGICQMCHGTSIKYVTIKIADFGLSKSEKQVKNMVQGTVAYLAPEIFSKALYTIKSDVYSFGVVLWEVISGKKPYHENDGLVDIIKEINNDVINYYESISILSQSFSSNSIDKNYSKIPTTIIFKNLILSCLNDNYKERPSFSEIIKMIEDIKIKLIINKIKNETDQDIAEIFAEKDKRIEVLEYALALSTRNDKDYYNTFPRDLKSLLKIKKECKQCMNFSTLALNSFNNNANDNSIPIEMPSNYISVYSSQQNSSFSQLLINEEYISISNKKE